MNTISKIEKIDGVVYDDASAAKLLMVNAIIEAWNESGWKLTKDSPIVASLMEDSYMGCVDCGLSDCISELNGVPYEEALQELRDAVEYEIKFCLEHNIDAHATKEYAIKMGWALA